MNRGAFSLAEMMIALAILAMGLLVIGAALPIGVSYTQQSMNISLGQDAVEYALDTIEQNVCLYATVVPPPSIQFGSDPRNAEPGVFEPRYPPGTPDINGDGIPEEGCTVPGHEPLIKVRPLYVQAVDATPGASNYGDEGVALVEEAVRQWLGTTGFSNFDTRECDRADPYNWMHAALASACAVYPPITPDREWTTAEFFDDKYARRPLLGPNTNPPGAETIKVLERRLTWTAFYRRVSYEPGSDPSLYEFIVVAVRRPSDRHRFPVQAVANAGRFADAADNGAAANSSSVGGASTDDVSAPVPWLVSFTALPTPPRGFSQTNGAPLDVNNSEMMVGQAPATLKFKCGIDRSALFPVGTIFIPARNDLAPALRPIGFESLRCGFGPPSPTALPIYEVVERPDDTTILVKYNGYYPMQGTLVTGLPLVTPPPGQWPVWVIPPAYENRDSGGNPIAPDECQIVAVGRRYIHLRVR